MRLLSASIMLALAAIPAMAAASGTPAVKSGPATVPYSCDHGLATVIYESGSNYQHARALVSYDGRTIELRAAPALYGVRYRSEAAEGAPSLAWSLRGEEAWLTESPDEDGYTRDEHALARCVRVRSGAPSAAVAAPHDDH